MFLSTQNLGVVAALAYRCGFTVLRWSDSKWLSAVCKVRTVWRHSEGSCVCVCVSECEGEKERQHHSLKEWSRFHIFCQVISVWIKFGIKPGVMFGSEWQSNVKLDWIKCSMFGSLLNVNVRAVEHYCYTFEFVHRSITETWLQQKNENCIENMKLQGEIRLSVSILSFATVHSPVVFQQKNVQM